MKNTQLHVLVIEDDVQDTELVRELISKESKEKVELECVDRMQKGLNSLTSLNNIDIVLLDLTLPDSQGLETFARVQAKSGEIPIIVMTGHDDDQVALKAVQAGAQDFLVKGRFDGNLLVRTMRHSIERKRAEEERQRLETQMQYTQKLESLGVLAGGIAHDFNNLLMTIVARAGLALRALSPESPVREHIKQIEKAGLRGGELANQMLVYAGRGKPVIQPVNISNLIKEMAHLLHVSISKQAILHQDLDPQPPTIQADIAQLRQIVMNLITNASEAIGERGGMVTLATGSTTIIREDFRDWHVVGDLPSKPCVYLDVRDSGSGMDAETLPKIFDPFFTTKFTGRGLGLAALLGIVRAHGGAVAVWSQPKEGTYFRLFFPCVQTRPLESKVLPDTDLAWRGNGTILVVDDEEDVRIASQLILEETGFHVVTARDGRHGLQVFKEQREGITAVLLDLTMPHMNGEQLFQEIRQLNPTIPVILSSGYTEEDALKRFTGAGINSFIQKPYQVDALITKVRQVLEKSR